MGTGLAVVGSLYLLLAADMAAEESGQAIQPEQANSRAIERCRRCATCAVYDDDDSSDSTRSRHSSRSRGRRASTELSRTATHPSVTRTVDGTETIQTEQTLDDSRRQLARFFNNLSKQVTRRVHEHVQESGFNIRGITEYPMVPGEPLRNRNLPVVQKAYSSTPLPRSRAQSLIRSTHSDSQSGEGSSRTPPQGSSRHLSLPITPPPRVVTRQRHSNTFSSGENSSQSRERLNPPVLEDGHLLGRDRSPSRGSISVEEYASRTPSIPEVSPTNVAFDGEAGTSPRIVVSEP